MNDLTITTVQPDIVWENKKVNLENYLSLLAEVQETDLIILPEMFSTGFSMQPQNLAEADASKTLEWMKNLAAEKNAAVTGSIIWKEAGKYFNRLFFVRPSGDFDTYDKRHLFSFADEHSHYSSGAKRLIVEWRGWKICPLVCYDLRFPIWSRNAPLNKENRLDFQYDLLIYVANWPAARSKPWTNLLEARAHENQSYVVGVNRVGNDGNGIPHSGDSRVFGPKGDSLWEAIGSKEEVVTLNLSKTDLNSFRTKFTAWRDRDVFKLGN